MQSLVAVNFRGQEFSRASQVRRAAIYSVGIAGGVALALLVMFGLLDDRDRDAIVQKLPKGSPGPANGLPN